MAFVKYVLESNLAQMSRIIFLASQIQQWSNITPYVNSSLTAYIFPFPNANRSALEDQQAQTPRFLNCQYQQDRNLWNYEQRSEHNGFNEQVYSNFVLCRSYFQRVFFKICKACPLMAVRVKLFILARWSSPAGMAGPATF